MQLIHSTAKSIEPARAPRAYQRTEEILVVDDDPDTCVIIKEILEDDGLPVVTASSGREAIALALRKRPALITLDLHLSDLRGEAIAGALSAAYGTSVPVILVSGDPDAEEVAGRVGAAACLGKPFASKELLAAVRRALVPAVRV